ncbi:MAG: DUF1499 domain-containing protein [Gemmatimonadota bacterium]|nr:DUF1499 domain-containing protein [Gemmatimonadota bacterium]
MSLILAALGCGGTPPTDLGPANGSLAPCAPGARNCVHTGLRYPDGTEGMYLDTDVPSSELMARIRSVVESLPRTAVVAESSGYLRAEARSLLFRFVDDVELLVTADGELVVRSASRVGRGDLGVNRKRVERLRDGLREAGVIR